MMVMPPCKCCSGSFLTLFLIWFSFRSMLIMASLVYLPISACVVWQPHLVTVGVGLVSHGMCSWLWWLWNCVNVAVVFAIYLETGVPVFFGTSSKGSSAAWIPSSMFPWMRHSARSASQTGSPGLKGSFSLIPFASESFPARPNRSINWAFVTVIRKRNDNKKLQSPGLCVEETKRIGKVPITILITNW